MWTAFGAVLGPLAVVLLILAPPGRCRSCGARVQGWSMTCVRCGRDVDAPEQATGNEAPGQRPLISVFPTQRVIQAEPAWNPAAMHQAGNGTSTLAIPDPIVVPVRSEPAPDLAPVVAEPATSKPVTSKPAAKPARAASPKRPRKRAAPSTDVEPPLPQPIGGGVYYSGTAPLSAGSRYALRLVGSNLQVLGPHDRDPRRVAFERSVTGADADVTDDRLIITLGDGRNTTLLVFVALEGGRPAALAQTIRDAALATGPDQ